MSFPESIIVFDQNKEIKLCMSQVFEASQRIYIDVCDNSVQLERAIAEKIYDIVLIDLDGVDLDEIFYISQKIKEINNIPIIMLSGYKESSILQKIIEFEPYGFIFKPFSKRDIEYTIKLAYHHYMRDIQSQKNDLNKPSEIVRIDQKYRFDMKTKSLYQYDQRVKLDMKSEKLIECLCQNINHTVSSESIVYALWGDKNISGSTLRTFIYRLRKKLPDLPIISYSKFGYVLQRVV